MQKNDVKRTMIYCLSFLFLWILLVVKIAPSYIAGDSPETIMAFNFLGIQHPPGYVLDTMLGKIFLLIPVGNIMFRAAIMAMIFNMLTAFVIFNIILIIFQKEEKNYKIYFTATAASAFYLFSNSVFIQGITAKGSVYTLQSFLISMIFLSLFQIKRSNKYLYLSTFLFALSLGNHWQSSVALFPAMVLSLFIINGKINLRSWLKCFLFLLIGISVCIYLIVRKTNLIWNNVLNLNNLIWFLSRAQYAHHEHPHIFSIIDSFRLLKYYFSGILPEQYPLFLVFVLFPGSALLLWKLKKYGYVFIAAFVCYLSGILFVSTEIGQEWVDKQFITYIIFVSIFISFFFYWIINLLKISKTMTSILFISIFLLLYINLPDYSRYFLSYDYVNNLTLDLPKGCLFFTEGDINSFGAFYKQHIDKNDLNTIAVGFLTFQWYREQIMRNNFESIVIPEKGRAFNLADDIKNIMSANKNKEIYSSSFSSNDLLIYPKIPVGITCKILIDKDQTQIDPYLPYRFYAYRGIFDNKIVYDDFSKMLVLSTYEKCLAQLGDNFGNKGNIDQALFFYNHAFLFSKEDSLATNIGICYLQKGEATKSEEYLDEALRLNPKFVTAYYYKAAVAYMLLKDPVKTKENLIKVLELDKNNINAKELLSKLNSGT